MAEPVYKVAHWLPVSIEVDRDARPVRLVLDNWFRYGWNPPYADPNPMPRFRLWRWWP